MKRSFIIEGLPIAFGDSIPDWAEQELIPDSICTTPKINKSLDPFGGVESYEDISLELADTQNNEIAKYFRFIGSDNEDVTITDPDPLPYNYVGAAVTLGTGDYHPAQKRISESTAEGKIHTKQVDSFPSGITFEFWQYNSGNTGNVAIIPGKFWLYKVSTTRYRWYTYDGAFTTYLQSGVTLGSKINHVVFTQVSSMCYNYVNGVLAASGTCPVMPDTTDIDLYINKWNAGGYSTPSSNYEGLRLWKRVLSADEVLDSYEGRKLDKTDCIFDNRNMYPQNHYQNAELTGATTITDNITWDMSEYKNHLVWASNPGTAVRQWKPGDNIYFPASTASIMARTGSGTYQLDNQRYSCLEDKYCPYYQTVWPNEYVAKGNTSTPTTYSYRLCAYYEDDKLVYIGRINNIEQIGKKWKITASHILKSLDEGFKVPVLSVGMASDWYFDPAAAGGIDVSYSYKQGGAYPVLNGNEHIGFGSATAANMDGNTLITLINDCAAVTTSYLSFDAQLGLNLKRYNMDVITQGGTCTANDNMKWLWDDGFTMYATSSVIGLYSYSPTSKGMPMYGCVFSEGSEIYVDFGGSTVYMEGARCYFTSSKNEECYFRVANFNAVSGVITVGKIYRKEDDQSIGSAAILSWDQPIRFSITPYMEASNWWTFIYSLITSTGGGANGDYDDYSGTVGLGLPEELLDTDFTGFEGKKITFNGDVSKFSDDLAAHGIALIFKDEKFKLKRIYPPTAAAAEDFIDDTKVDPGAFQRIGWGHHAPVNSFKYTYKKDDKNTETNVITAISQNVWEAAEMRTKEYTGSYIPVSNLANWAYLQHSRLAWYSSYAPTVRFVYPYHNLSLGDNVLISSKLIAGTGAYGVSDIPALIVKLQDDWIVEAVLNTKSKLNAKWVPSLLITGYTGGNITVLRDALKFEALVNLPFTGQIIAPDGQILDATVTITSITSDTALVLSAAPTYDPTEFMGILTFPDYTSALDADKLLYAWASDGTEMSDGDPAKYYI